MKHHILMLAVVFKVSLGLTGNNNVCKSFMGYYFNNDCYHNPDQFLGLTDLIKRYGYPVETHTVTTDDGYILQVFRIPSNSSTSTPVFLQHGLASSGFSFFLAGKDSLAFLIADAGYDVWIGNFRGNRFSKRHVSLNYDDLEFWTFSIHEMGKYDLSAQLNLVKATTNQKAIYIGISMGTSTSYIYSVVNSEEAKENIKAIISLAPIVYLENIPSILTLFSPLWGGIEAYFNTFFHGEIDTQQNSASLLPSCLPYPHQMFLCQFILQLTFGPDPSQFNPETLPVIVSQNGDSMSTKTVTHYHQFLHSNRFQYFDYGPEENERRYQSVQPPLYNLSAISYPVYLVYGKNDYFATMENVYKLYGELPSDTRIAEPYAVPYDSFNHEDFITAKDVKILLYDHLLSVLAKL